MALPNAMTQHSFQTDTTHELAAVPRKRASKAGVLAIAMTALLCTAARAADGCLVLLCLAAPSWQNIGQCVDPVRDVLRRLAHGDAFPSCSTTGRDNNAVNEWSSAPTLCPPQYTYAYELFGTMVYSCTYAGAIVVTVNGALWSRTWWRFWDNDTVTEFTPAAKAQLGHWDTRFDDDYAAWLAALPPAAPGCTTC